MHGYYVERFIVGTLMTSIDGHGLSLTILKVQDTKWIEYLDAVSAISNLWNISTPSSNPIKEPQHTTELEYFVQETGVEVDEETAKRIKACLLSACKVIIANEKKLNTLDEVCGDGDCGSSMKAGARAIKFAIANNELNFKKPKLLLYKLSQIFEDTIGGTSGALYTLLLGAASKSFETSFTSADCKSALENGLKAIIYYGHGRTGNRTLIDALNAVAVEKSNNWHKIVQDVEKAAFLTAKMEAKSGRASYTSVIQQKDVDPGAHAVALWFRAIYDTYYK